MITSIISILSVIIVVTTAFVLNYKNEQAKKDSHKKMQGIVDQINDSQYYEYQFDKKQEQNIKNLDENVTNVHKNLVTLQNNVKFLEKNTLRKEDLQKNLQTDIADVNTIKTKKVTIANSTNKNNIVLEGGRTIDGANEGWAAINFNGYYDNGEQRIDPTKSRFRMMSEQRGDTDALGFDQFDKNNQWWNYVWMTDGTVGLNNNKLRFSNKWTAFPDQATDQSEISNDVKDYQKLMIVGNKSSGEGIRKVGIWDQLDVHGNQLISGKLDAKNVEGRDKVMTADGAVWMNKDGLMNVGDSINVQNKIFFKDQSFSTVPNGTNNSDPYYLEKVTLGGNDSHLRLTMKDDPDESFQIWGDSCRSGDCSGPGVMKHKFDAAGNAWHGDWVDAQNVQGRDSVRTGVASMRNDGTISGKRLNASSHVVLGNDAAWMRHDGYTKVNMLQLGDKWRLSGVGDGMGNDSWLRLTDINSLDYWGGLAAADLWTKRGSLAGSDVRMKKDITGLSPTETANVTSLEPKSYTLKDDSNGQKRYGFIAQDVEKIYPNLVEEGANGMKSLRYNEFIPLIVSKLKDVEKNKACVDGVCLTKEDILKLKRL